MEQTFTLAVTHSQGGQHTIDQPRVLAYTSTQPNPEFMLSQLEPGVRYILTIMAVNKKGQSQPMRLAIKTQLEIAGKQTSPTAVNLPLHPILAAVSGLIALVLLV
ncbi:unnamed protein product, partial [Meganyctiphanes norvegica]